MIIRPVACIATPAHSREESIPILPGVHALTLELSTACQAFDRQKTRGCIVHKLKLQSCSKLQDHGGKLDICVNARDGSL